MMKVLLAIDGSEYSDAAIEEITRRFSPAATSVRVVHAVEWLKEMPIYAQFAEGPNAGRDAVESRKRSFLRGDQLVARAAAALEAKGFRTDVKTPDMDPRHAIIHSAREWGADLIVMGSHGRRGVDRVLLGSVAEWVVRHAPCSVEVVRLPVAA
jgi:nucleotide-binding universal stress UspA family protein